MSFALWERHKAPSRVDRRRSPEKSDLFRIVFNYHEVLEQVWEERYQPAYGCYRDEVKDAFYKYLDCGILAHGCARVEYQNPDCIHSDVIAFSCKRRGVCPQLYADALPNGKPGCVMALETAGDHLNFHLLFF